MTSRMIETLYERTTITRYKSKYYSEEYALRVLGLHP